MSATTNDIYDGPAPHVLIAGAGLGGLLLAVLFERVGIPYTIYERSKTLRPLGAHMAFGANTLPIFEQLGMLEQILDISLPCFKVDMFNSDLSLIGGFEFGQYKERTGYDTITFLRRSLHKLLLERVPSERVLLGKRILSHVQGTQGVTVRCSDGTAYTGDILVGADGAYSAIRQSLYQMMAKEGGLPASDTEDLSTGHTCMVGTTVALDPEKYPVLKDRRSHFDRIIAQNTKYSWSVATVPGNKMGWMLTSQMEAVESKDASFRNSEWGPEANLATIKECYHYPNPLGGTMGDLMDATPAETISKVFLEEKMFKTWSYGRTVLIGDAVHKFLPSAGQGSQSAFQDAVILANAIYEMPTVTHENIMAAFRDYKNQRYGPAKAQMDKSKIMGTMLYGQTWNERLTRHILFNWIPKSIQTGQFHKDASYRPQCNFLPFAENRGLVPVREQKRSKKYAEKISRHEVSAV